MGRTVYIVIPVYNRLERTTRCVELLLGQTYGSIKIIICDGGSTDGTVEHLRENFPSVTVLVSPKEVWWGGATKMGVDHVMLEAHNDDFLMLMNDDTAFQADYVQKLVDASIEHVAGLCGIVVREGDHSHIMDAGVSLDWKNFAFRAKDKTIIPESGIDLDSSVLPGRGTLYPMWAVKRAGTINEKDFPHYLSDYEFSMRVKKRSGIKLGVLYTAVIETEYVAENEGVVVEEPDRGAFGETWHRYKKVRSKRTKQNLPSGMAFINQHAPYSMRDAIKKKVAKDTRNHVFTPLWEGAEKNPVIRPFAGLFKALFKTGPQKIGFLLKSPYIVPISDLKKFNLEQLPLFQHQILAKSRFPGYFQVKRPRSYLEERYPDALPLFDYGNRPIRKLNRVLDSRGVYKPFAFVRNFFKGPYLISHQEIIDLELDFLKMRQHQILVESGYKGMFKFGRPIGYTLEHYPAGKSAYAHAAKLGLKLKRVYEYKISKKMSNDNAEAVDKHAAE